jgi:hypothetical protein
MTCIGAVEECIAKESLRRKPHRTEGRGSLFFKRGILWEEVITPQTHATCQALGLVLGLETTEISR